MATPRRSKADLQLTRYRRALAGLSRWRSRLKRALTAIDKLERQVSYYQRELKKSGGLK